MSNSPAFQISKTLERISTWLRSDANLTLPGWAVALAGTLVFALLLVALD